jgi:hypothetical protein
MAEEQVGFDMENSGININYLRIAERFFTQEECQLIRSAGLEAFFEVLGAEGSLCEISRTGSVRRVVRLFRSSPRKMEQGSSPCVIRHCVPARRQGGVLLRQRKIIRDTVGLKDDSGML